MKAIRRAGGVAGIAHDEIERTIAHTLGEGFLFASGGLLSMGEPAERKFGRKDFLELHAVFMKPRCRPSTSHVGGAEGRHRGVYVRGLSSGSCP